MSLLSDALKEAIRRDSLVHTRKLLERHPIDLNDTDVPCDAYDVDEPDEIPFRFWVVQVGASREMVEMLIEQGLDITQINREGLSTLDVAIKQRRRDLVELCAEQGVSLTTTQRRSGLTPLMLAASLGDQEMVAFLVEQGASIDDTDKRGTTVLEYARILGQTKMVAFLEGIKASHDKKQER